LHFYSLVFLYFYVFLRSRYILKVFLYKTMSVFVIKTEYVGSFYKSQHLYVNDFHIIYTAY
jgi:hypothetical protein